MNSMVKPYLLRASLLAVLTICLGIALSIIVFMATKKIQENAVDLVESRIPILTSVNQLIADLSEQERIIYEYYRSQDEQVFLKDSQAIRATFAMHSAAIMKDVRFKVQSAQISDTQRKIEQAFAQFHQEMQVNEDNWDEMRAILSTVSQLRTEILPTLLEVEELTKIAVDEGHLNTLAQMERTNHMVIAYGIAIVFISGVVSWYIRQYTLTQVKNTRLALFSHKNPDPIISLNNVGEVTFANPASEALLEKVGCHPKDMQQLLPSNFFDVRNSIAQQELSSLSFEQSLKNRVLNININWHKDIDAYDIHIRDITERKLAEQSVKHLAFYTQETNLPNQFKLNHDIDELIASDRKFSIGIMQIRNFTKTLSAVDVDTKIALLKVFTHKIAKYLPSGIGFYQLNDSQFALVCTDSVNHLAIQKLAKTVSNATQHGFSTEFGDFFLDVDFGFSCHPNHGNDHNTLQQYAQMALSVVNEDEHEFVRIYEEHLSDCISKKNELTDALRNAVNNDELFLVFQPQLDIQTNMITGCETLVRWRHNGAVVSPAEFIPLTESSGLIVEIGQWILEQACYFGKKMMQQGNPDFVVAVNVSPRQFSHPQFSQTVLRTLAATQLPAKNLELEITEGVFMHNEANTIAVLHQLKSAGIQLSIDDFGTGYSSLSYLKRFPVDKLKIDQSFIKDCHNNDEDKAIVDTIVALGKNLNLTLIAEGVEEEAHRDFLREVGCHEIQGYWFSRPLEKADFESFYCEYHFEGKAG